MNSKPNLSRRQIRWAEELQRYNFDWLYQKGKDNIADPLSRLPSADIKATLQAVTRRKTTENNKNRGNKHSPAEHEESTPESDVDTADVMSPSPLLDRIKEAYQHDPWIKNTNNTRAFTHKAGLWWHDGKLVVPNDPGIKADILREAHDALYSGHFGFEKTLKNIKRYYWWPLVYTEAKKYCRTCDSCQRMKASNRKPAGPLQPLPIPERNWESVSLDLITDLPATPRGHDTVVVFVDRLSKMTHFAPCKKTVTATELAEIFLREVVRLHGFQKNLVMDRDTRFTSQFFQDVCRMFGTKLNMSTAFHPQTDGQTERMNRILEDALRHYVSPTQTDWDLYLTPLEFAVNNSVQESTKETPFTLNYGFDPSSPLNLDLQVKSGSAQDMAKQLQQRLADAKLAIQKAQNRQRQQANKKRDFAMYNTGDLVLLNTKNFRFKSTGVRKLMPRWCGPFKVEKAIGLVAYRLELPPNLRMHNVFHVSLLKQYHKDTRSVLPPPPELIDDSLEHEVDSILDHRDTKQGDKTIREYLVQWKGYGPEYNLWEPEDNLENCPILLKEYWDAKNKVHRSRKQSTKRKKVEQARPASAPNKRNRRAPNTRH